VGDDGGAVSDPVAEAGYVRPREVRDDDGERAVVTEQPADPLVVLPCPVLADGGVEDPDGVALERATSV
jgi:hypothetical protein